jgi:hypothetical protein
MSVTAHLGVLARVRVERSVGTTPAGHLEPQPRRGRLFDRLVRSHWLRPVQTPINRPLVRPGARRRPAVRCRRSRDDLPREREVGDAAGGGDRLDVVGLLDGL